MKGKKVARVETLKRTGGRVVIVGDIHGCLKQLKDLLQSVSFDVSRDQLVTVGDLVNKGPNSLGVVQLLQHMKARSVLGNHDIKLLKLIRKLREEGKLHGKDRDSTLAPLAASFSPDTEKFLSETPHILRIPQHNVVVVHAGLNPAMPLEQQRVKEVTTMRNLILQGGDGKAFVPTENTHEGVPWASVWHGPEMVVFGHDAKRRLQNHPFAIGLDTGCVYNGELTAVVFPGKRIVSVPGWAAE